ncbi:MAG: endonuclease/exonuclease/phosphatase family protein [Rikenellaceae bacterium]
MRAVTSTILMSLFCLTLFSQEPHTIVFYNIENFFDTIDNPATNDQEFTPEGKNRWSSDKYAVKLGNIEQVFSDIAAINNTLPTIIGVAEVEVRNILEDIASTPKLAPAEYQIVHYDSPDERGIDVAFLYRPDKFQIEGSFAERAYVPDMPDFRTRDILTMWGTIQGEELFFAVAHWPSRWGGKEQSEHLRIASGNQMRQIIDSVKTIRPKSKFVIMGDLNDDPSDKSVAEALGAKGNIKKLDGDDLFTPFEVMHKAGHGTLAYNGEWNLFDNIIVSHNLVNAPKNTLQLQKSIDSKKFYGNIFKPSYLIQTEGKYRGYPYRTFSGGEFIGGYSDHLPVFINIE